MTDGLSGQKLCQRSLYVFESCLESRINVSNTCWGHVDGALHPPAFYWSLKLMLLLPHCLDQQLKRKRTKNSFPAVSYRSCVWQLKGWFVEKKTPLILYFEPQHYWLFIFITQETVPRRLKLPHWGFVQTKDVFQEVEQFQLISRKLLGSCSWDIHWLNTVNRPEHKLNLSHISYCLFITESIHNGNPQKHRHIDDRINLHSIRF